MFINCPEPVWIFNADEIESAGDTICSLKNIFMAVYKRHQEPRIYKLSTDAAKKFGEYFTEFRETVRLATKDDTFIW